MFRTTYQGHKKKSWVQSWVPWTIPKQLYLVDHLGTGSTSKVYRALTPDGFDCVVKMYVKRRDDDKSILDKSEFDKNAKAAIAREMKAYTKIYGDELKGYVRQQTLNGMYCLIHPYFKHPEKDSRIDLLPQISKRLLDCFVKGNQLFATSDQVWRHVGWFNDKLYLFDLADLETYTGNAVKLVEDHTKQLRDDKDDR
jgi:serine/threonine protein kinase